MGFLLASAVVGAAAVAILRRERSHAATALALGVAVCVAHSLVDIDWDYVAVQGPLFLTVGALASGDGGPAPRRRWVFGAAVGVCALAALYSLMSPWLAEHRVNAAYDALAREDFAKAGDEAQSAHALNPLAVEPLWVWALAESNKKALQLYRQARDLEPKNPDTWYELGAFELYLNRPRDAYRDLNQSYTLDRYGAAGERCGALARPTTTI